MQLTDPSIQSVCLPRSFVNIHSLGEVHEAREVPERGNVIVHRSINSGIPGALIP
jgi:hypothetical protein